MIENFFQGYFLVKLLILFLILFYEVFSFAVLNQIKTMNQIVLQPSSTIVEYIAKANLITGFALFLLGLAVL